MNNRQLRDIIEQIKEKEGLGLNDIAANCGVDRSYLSKFINLEEIKNVTGQLFGRISSKYPSYFSEDLFDGGKTTKTTIRAPKVSDNPLKDGLVFVPIAAQAGYTQQYTDPIYLNQLERVYIPGFPYRGPRYRIFEVNGESMEPTFKEGFHLVAETVDKDSWHQIANYYIYVIVLENEILTKRLFKKSETEFVAISDNEEFFPQFIINKADIKELWLVKRKLDWEMPPPKRFEISI